MYCTQCGSLLKDGARFCTKCGAQVIADSEKTQANNAGAEAVTCASEGRAEAPSRQTLGQFFMSPRRIGQITVPTFAAIIAALIAFAGAAYAAAMVYKNVIEPAIQQAQQDTTQTQSAEDEAGEEAVSVEEETAPEEPKNAVQLIDILSMDSTKLADYLESQGAERVTVGADAGIHFSAGDLSVYGSPDSWSEITSYASPFLYWTDTHGNTVFPGILSSSGVDFSTNLSGHGIPPCDAHLVVGSNIDAASIPHVEHSYSLASEEGLQSGMSYDCILLSLTSGEMSKAQGEAVAETCGFRTAAQYWEYDSRETSQGKTFSKAQTWAGEAVGTKVPSIWFIYKRDSDVTIGVVSDSAARLVVEDVQVNVPLISLSEFDAMSESDKALAFCQCMLQNLEGGTGYSKYNVVTGEEIVR